MKALKLGWQTSTVVIFRQYMLFSAVNCPNLFDTEDAILFYNSFLFHLAKPIPFFEVIFPKLRETINATCMLRADICLLLTKHGRWVSCTISTVYRCRVQSTRHIDAFVQSARQYRCRVQSTQHECAYKYTHKPLLSSLI